MSMKDLISKMDSIQGVQTTGLPSTSTTQSGPRLLNERDTSLDEVSIAPLAKGIVNYGGKALSGIAGGLERVGNAVVQGTKGAIGGLTGKAPTSTTATKAASKLEPKKVSLGPKRSNIKTATTAAAEPARTGLQKAGDVAAKVAKTGLGAATVGAAAYGGKAAYDALTKDDNKSDVTPEPSPSPSPAPAPKPPVVGPKPSEIPADDVKPVTDVPAKTDDMPNMQKPVPSQRPSLLPPDTMSDLVKRTRQNIDSMDNEPDPDRFGKPNVNIDPTKLTPPTPTDTASDLPKEEPKPSRDYSTGRPVDKELDTKYGTGNTRTDDQGRTYVRQKGIMGQPDSEQRSYASFGDFFNKIRGQGDVNGRMDEEVEQLLDAIIEAQEIDRITGLSGISEAVSSNYYDDYDKQTRGGDSWKDAKNYKAIKDPLAGSKAYQKDSPYGYGRYGKNTADMQKFINQLGYKDKSGNPLSIDARMGPKTGIAVDALRKKLDPNSAEYKTLRAFDDAAILGDKDSRVVAPTKKPTPAKPTTTSDVPAPSNTPEPKVNPSPMNADSLRAKLDAAAGKDTATPASTSALPKPDDSGQPVLKTADEWQKDKEARQAGLSFAGKSADTTATPGSTSALPKADDTTTSPKPSKSFQQMGMVGQDFEESIMNEANEIARIASLSGLVLSEAKMKDLASKKVKGSYGTEYQGDEDEDETTDKKSKAKDGEKKKRGGQFKGDKDTSGKEKFGGADDAMKAMGVGKAKKSKELDKLPAKKHSLKEYFDETEALILAEAQHSTIMDEVADAMFQLETALFESKGLLDEQQCFEHICECYPHEVKLFIDNGELDPDLFHELSDHYKRHARVPHRIARERDVTTLFDLIKGLFEGDLGMNAEVHQAEEPMEEVDEGIEDALQNILPKSMQPFNYQTAAAASKAQAPVKEETKPW